MYLFVSFMTFLIYIFYYAKEVYLFYALVHNSSGFLRQCYYKWLEKMFSVNFAEKTMTVCSIFVNGNIHVHLLPNLSTEFWRCYFNLLIATAKRIDKKLKNNRF